MYRGWTQVAFVAEVTADVTPVDVAGRALVAVRSEDGIAVFDGRCPHRGAHLGHGGRLEGSVLVCPFHGHRVHLGDDARRSGPFCVRGYRTVQACGGVFVLLDEQHDTGLESRLLALDASHHTRPAFTRPIAVGPEYVIENVLDADHFAAVHAVLGRPRLTVEETPAGTLVVQGRLNVVRPNKWQSGGPDGAATSDGAVPTGFRAEVYSPTVVVTQLGSEGSPHVVITAATESSLGGSTARVIVALARGSGGAGPTVGELSSLISGSRTAFEQDAVIWDHLDTSIRPQYLPSDHLVQTYREYCHRFAELQATAAHP